MRAFTRESIQAAFDRLGLGTDADRQRFRDLGIPQPLEDERYYPIRLDLGSMVTAQEEAHAELARVTDRHQGQG
jgi:hypothetical protein